MEKLNNDIIYKIQYMQSAKNIKHLCKGYSGDLKYTFTKDNFNYLIRFNKADTVDRKMPNLTKKDKHHLVVEYMKSAYNLGVRCPQVFDYGYLEEYNLIYIITSFIDGEDADSIMDNLNNDKKYKIGFELGRDINKLHTIKVNQTEINWEQEILEPLDRNLIKYNKHKDECTIKLDSNIEKTLLSYITANKNLLKNRDIKLIHNDIHARNIIIKNDEYVGLIDFNEIMYADKFFDHKYLTHPTTYKHPYFCKGIVDGYFNNKIPDDFWNMILFYNAWSIMRYNAIANPDWFSIDDIKEDAESSKKMYYELGEFKTKVPKWYIDISK